MITLKNAETKVMAHENFNTYKASFIEWCKKNSACQDEFKKVLASQNEAELLQVIHANFYWCIEKAFDANVLKVAFGDDVLFAAKIIIGDISGKSVSEGIWRIYSSAVNAYGSSTVNAYGSSTVRAWDSSKVEAYGSSNINAYDSSTVRAYDLSAVRAWDSSKVEAYDSSTVNAHGSSTVKALDYAIVHVRKNGHKIELGANWKMEDISIVS